MPPSQRLILPQEQPKPAKEQRQPGCSLVRPTVGGPGFPPRFGRRWLIILWKKQQKQREAHASYGVARCLCAPRIRGGTRRSPLDPIVRGFVAPRRAPARPVQPTTHRWGYGRTLVLKARLKLEAERVRQAVRRHLRTLTLSLLRLGRGAACPSHRLDWPLSAPRR